MTRLTDYPPLSSPDGNDVLFAVDVSDQGQSSAGSTKKLRVGALPFLACEFNTASAWTTANTVLAAGTLGIESDTGKGKLGDGSTAWASLPYWSPSGAGASRVGSITKTLTTTMAITHAVTQPQSHTAGVSAEVDVFPSVSGSAVSSSPASSPVDAVPGSIAVWNNFGSPTLDVSPSKVGNLLVLAINGQGDSPLSGTTVTGGGVTEWARATGVQYNLGGVPQNAVEIWTGIITAAGATTLTVANAGFATAWPKVYVEEFTSSGNGLEWTIVQASPSSPTIQSSPSVAGSPVALPDALAAGSYLGAASAEWGTYVAVPVAGVTYKMQAAALGIAEYLNGPSDVAPSFTDTNTGDNSNVAAIIFTAATLYTSLEIILPGDVPEGTATEPYSLAFSGAGGSGSGYQFAVVSGALPSGLTMSSSGNISGTIAAAGTSTFAVKLIDSAGASTISKNISITAVALPPVIFTRTYPTDSDYNYNYPSTVNIPEIYIEGAGSNSTAIVGMDMWNPQPAEAGTINAYSIPEWDFLCKVNNPGNSVTCFPNSASYLINIPNWHDFDYFISGWDEVMDGTQASPGDVTASACYDNWFTNTLVNDVTGHAVNEIMCHFDFRNRGSGPYVPGGLGVTFGGYTVNGIDIPLTYWNISYSATTLYFLQVDSSGNFLSSPTGAVDWKAMFDWCVTNGYLDPAAPMWGFSLGFEICNTNGVQHKFRYNNLWWLAGHN